jgi:hypothetical protein
MTCGDFKGISATCDLLNRPNKKAKELVWDYLQFLDNGKIEIAKKCAIIAVKQIIKIEQVEKIRFWEQVLIQIEKL